MAIETADRLTAASVRAIAYNGNIVNKLCWLLPVLTLTSCSEDDGRPPSEILISSRHHLFGLRSSADFEMFPVQANDVVTSRGYLEMTNDSVYTITFAAGNSASDNYAIGNAGSLSIYNSGSGNEPTTVFSGAYSMVGNNQVDNEADYFFADRATTPGSPRVGLFFGTRALNGQVELEGDWHMMSLHIIFDQFTVSPDNLGRAAFGDLSITAGAPGEQRDITGSGFQGAVNQLTTAMTFGGTVRNLLNGQATGDGALNLTLEYTPDPQPVVDTRIIQGAAGTENVIFGLDENTGDGEAGLITMIRKFDPVTAPIDPDSVAGTFLVGGHTLLLNPNDSGSDAFVGTVTLTTQGGFRLDSVGNAAESSYVGSYTLANDGGMTIEIEGTEESWFAAIDKSYNTFAFIDYFQETRPNNVPELSFGFGVRRN